MNELQTKKNPTTKGASDFRNNIFTKNDISIASYFEGARLKHKSYGLLTTVFSSQLNLRFLQDTNVGSVIQSKSWEFYTN